MVTSILSTHFNFKDPHKNQFIKQRKRMTVTKRFQTGGMKVTAAAKNKNFFFKVPDARDTIKNTLIETLFGRKWSTNMQKPLFP